MIVPGGGVVNLDGAITVRLQIERLVSGRMWLPADAGPSLGKCCPEDGAFSRAMGATSMAAEQRRRALGHDPNTNRRMETPGREQSR